MTKLTLLIKEIKKVVLLKVQLLLQTTLILKGQTKSSGILMIKLKWESKWNPIAPKSKTYPYKGVLDNMHKNRNNKIVW